MVQETQTGALCQPEWVTWGGRWEGVEEEGDICIPMADSSSGLTKKQYFIKQLSFNKKLI